MINKYNQHKGVTPVIAIVLLLTVTIGAVGILYTQVGDLLNQDEGLDDIDRVQDTEIDIRSAVSTNTDPDAGNIGLSISNSGDRAIPFNEDFTMRVNGVGYESYAAVNSGFSNSTLWSSNAGCFSENMNLDVGETTADMGLDDDYCDSGIDFPSAFEEEVEITFKLKGSSRTWSYTCNPQTGDTRFC